MKIAELLSDPASAARDDRRDAAMSKNESDSDNGDAQSAHDSPPRARKLGMASLDHFARQKQHPVAKDLTLSRIIHELGTNRSLTHSHDTKLAIASTSAARSEQQQQQRFPSRIGLHDDASVAHDCHASDAVTERPLSTASAKNNKAAGADDAASATGARRRRTRAGFAPLTESEKRVKQRQLVKRSYYRKIDTINELRDEAEKLQDEFLAVLEGRRKYAAQHALSTSPFEALRDKYTALAISKHDLRHENEVLRAIAADQSKARTRMGILLDEELREQEEVARVADLASLRPQALSPPSPRGSGHARDGIVSEPAIEITPMTQTECLAVVKDAYTRIMEFRETQNLVSTGASVFGWRDRRKVDGDTMKFFLEKTFSRTAEDVATTMWSVLSTEAGVNRIYNAAIAIRFHLVQRVDANNVVFYRTIEREGQGIVIKALVLASLVQIETGYLLLFHSLDPATRLPAPRPDPNETQALVSPFAPRKREIWGDVFSWGLYEHAGENGDLCRNSFGGFVPSSSATSLEFWLMHILLIAVRCETEVIGSCFTLQ